MGSLYVTLSTRLSRPQDRLTGIPRVEYEMARELTERGGKVLRYDRLLRRFRITDLAGIVTAGQLGKGDRIVVPAILWRHSHLANLVQLRNALGLRIGVY